METVGIVKYSNGAQRVGGKGGAPKKKEEKKEEKKVQKKVQKKDEKKKGKAQIPCFGQVLISHNSFQVETQSPCFVLLYFIFYFILSRSENSLSPRAPPGRHKNAII